MCQKFALLTALTKSSQNPRCVLTTTSPIEADWPAACNCSGGGARMKLKIEQRENQGIFILDLKGRLVLGEEDLALRQQLTGHRHVILNLKDVSSIDTSALGTIVFFAQRFREAGGKLALLHLSDSQARLPEMLKLNTVLDIYEDEVDAVNSFFPERVVPRYDILDFVAQQELR
jgi:anti-sigma B factor antagonist